MENDSVLFYASTLIHIWPSITLNNITGQKVITNLYLIDSLLGSPVAEVLPNE